MEKQRQFMEIYDRFNDEIFRFCLSKTRNRDESLDIAQETFIKVWDYLRSGKTIDSVRGLIYRIARNNIIDRSRKKKASSLDAILEENFDSDIRDTSLENQEDRILTQSMIEDLKQLPEHHYEILVLRYIQELTLSEIATMYQESENTISVRIHRALKQAQKLFPNEIM